MCLWDQKRWQRAQYESVIIINNYTFPISPHGVRERSLFMAGGGWVGGRGSELEGRAKISRLIVVGGRLFFGILFWRGEFF